MTYELKELRGALFKNTDKVEGSDQPDFRGDLMVGGVKFRLSAWVRESIRGKFLSLSAKPDEPKGGGAKRAKQPADADAMLQ